MGTKSHFQLSQSGASVTGLHYCPDCTLWMNLMMFPFSSNPWFCCFTRAVFCVCVFFFSFFPERVRVECGFPEVMHVKARTQQFWLIHSLGWLMDKQYPSLEEWTRSLCVLAPVCCWRMFPSALREDFCFCQYSLIIPPTYLFFLFF